MKIGNIDFDQYYKLLSLQSSLNL